VPVGDPMRGDPPGSAGGTQTTSPAPDGDGCPLCGAPLVPGQDWCLRCGAAARTRLATSPAWRAPIVAVAVVAVLSLGVLTAALVKLAGKSPTRTTTITTTLPVAATPAPTTTSSGATGLGASGPTGGHAGATSSPGSPHVP
jgi:hypothetical protein